MNQWKKQTNPKAGMNILTFPPQKFIERVDKNQQGCKRYQQFYESTSPE